MQRHRSAQVGRRALISAVAAGVLIAAAATTGATQAAFTATTGADATFAAGSVVVRDDDAGTATLDVQGLLPGRSGESCLTVTYDGTLASMVPFWVSASAGSLAPYVTLTVLEGRGGGHGSCAGFVAERVAFAGTLDELATRHTGATTGAGAFMPGRPGQTRSYRFVYGLDDATPSAQQGQGAALTLRWDSQQADAVEPRLAGGNSGGQLGVGDKVDRSTFTGPAAGAETWLQVSAGGERSCGVKADGTLWCWGENDGGDLGDGTSVDRPSPVRIGTGTDWASVSVGATNACALTTAGALWCWGRGWGGNGDGTFTSRNTPVAVVGGMTWRSVSVGYATTCAIATDATLWCWGFNAAGQVGNGNTQNVNVPVQIGTATWTSVSFGGWHACGVQTDHTLWCWGFNGGRGVGDGTTTDRWAPVQVGTGRLWALAGLGSYQACAIALAGSLWCWGGWTQGFGTTPGQVGTATTWAQVAGGDESFCGTRQDRTLWCWGINSRGQFGDGTTSGANAAPAQLATGMAQVDSGELGGVHTITLPWPSPTP